MESKSHAMYNIYMLWYGDITWMDHRLCFLDQTQIPTLTLFYLITSHGDIHAAVLPIILNGMLLPRQPNLASINYISPMDTFMCGMPLSSHCLYPTAMVSILNGLPLHVRFIIAYRCSLYTTHTAKDLRTTSGWIVPRGDHTSIQMANSRRHIL